MRRALIILFCAALAGAAIIPELAREAHWRADAILWPAFISASNDWSFQHGQVSERGHLDKINTQDKKRYDTLCKDFEAWHDAMKQAGY
jgi:hypothetical protein